MKNHILCAILLGLLASLVAKADYNTDLLKRAHKGDVISMRKIGIRKINGAPGTPVDMRNGVAWLEKAAAKKDTEAMYRLGLLYMKGSYVGQDKVKAENLFREAAQRGHEKAQKKLAELAPVEKNNAREVAAVERKPAPEVKPPPVVASAPVAKPVVQQDVPEGSPTPAASNKELPASPSNKLLPTMVKDIAQRAERAGVKSIAVVGFLSNGGKTNNLTSTLRDEFLEAMLDAPSIEILDRRDSQLVAEESSLCFAGEEPLSPASAVLIGEVFCQPGDVYGYLAYRVFKASDTQIIAAGFERIKWSNAEQQLLNGAVSRRAGAILSFIDDDALSEAMQKMQSQLKSKVGIAMVQNGGANTDNTLDNRMAYSQVVAAMHKKGLELYEREFMSKAATESSIVNDVVSGGSGVGAVGHLRHTRSEGGQNHFKVQISKVPGGSLLSSVNVIQRSGSALGGKIGNSSENDLNDLLADLKKDAQEVKLRYEYEVYLSDQYAVPKEFINFFNGAYVVSEDGDRTHIEVYERRISDNVPDLMNRFTKGLARRLISEKNGEAKIKRLLQIAALFGVSVDDKSYVGPWNMCMMEAYTNLLYSHNGRLHKLRSNEYSGMVNEMINGEKNILSGRVEETRYFPAYNYQVSIEDRNGLPYKVKCVIDFSPSKNKLIKKQD